MYQAELLDRMLLSIEKTEDAFIDINNRIITNVNARKDRLNMINQRIQGISAKILALYDKNLIQIISPANLPKISTHGSASNHPHQSIFFDKVEVMPLADEIAEGAQENDEHTTSEGRIRRRMRSGEAAQRAEDNYKPLPLDAQYLMFHISINFFQIWYLLQYELFIQVGNFAGINIFK